MIDVVSLGDFLFWLSSSVLGRRFIITTSFFFTFFS